MPFSLWKRLSNKLGDLIYSARRLIDSNLGWFLITRSTLGEKAGNERAININKPILSAWFPDRDLSNGDPIDISTRYFDGELGNLESIKIDSRTIRNQGGGKNWRLAGNAIEGAHYNVRSGDLMIMAFDKSTNTLSWLIIRAGGDGTRNIPSGEATLHTAVEAALGHDDRNMWLLSENKTAQVLSLITRVFLKAGVLLMVQKAFIEAWSKAIESVGFIGNGNIANRLPIALQAKRFVILSGLSGSGKTLLARLFAKWISASPDQYALIAVGANWTSNENIVGYPDALNPESYVKTAALNLILRAIDNPDDPHLLILDEMNLSHVERYFADFLSAIESPGETMPLHGGTDKRDGVPAALPGFPQNLFVIGTVNVDETTYMFSPKVLDRANVIEFRAAIEAMSRFLLDPAKVTADGIDGQGAEFGNEFLVTANAEVVSKGLLNEIFSTELQLLFEILARHELEFGFRSAYEFMRYVSLKRSIEAEMDWPLEFELLRTSFDEQMVQKILPRLHGSRKRLEPILLELGAFCASERFWTDSGPGNLATVRVETENAIKNSSFNVPTDGPFLAISFEKIERLLERVRRDGFASFAEA